MTTTHILIVTIIYAITCLWIRRHTWKCRWELGGNIIIITMLGCVIFMCPTTAILIGEHLHWITGIWNVEDLIGHIFYTVGLISLVQVFANRTDAHSARVRRQLHLPIHIGLPLLAGLFVIAAPARHYPDMFQAPVTAWLFAYWTVLCIRSSYLLTQAWRYLKVLHRSPAHRPVVRIYATAVALDGCCVIAVLYTRAIGQHHEIAWLTLCAAVWVYCTAPTWSWLRRSRPLDFSEWERGNESRQSFDGTT